MKLKSKKQRDEKIPSFKGFISGILFLLLFTFILPEFLMSGLDKDSDNQNWEEYFRDIFKGSDDTTDSIYTNKYSEYKKKLP